jgi:hypothetical protein
MPVCRLLRHFLVSSPPMYSPWCVLSVEDWQSIFEKNGASSTTAAEGIRRQTHTTFRRSAAGHPPPPPYVVLREITYSQNGAFCVRL